ncbi:uncharacterized protein [Amphiura filiformis]|uniref:uncharacterized protein n=1 Tax=Amphiura filiformis TaxID=82378 RepID=UPI003B22640E
MTTARPQTSDSKSKIPTTQQLSTGRGKSSKMAAYKRFCCTDNMLLLPISGSFVGLLGLVLLVLYLVARGLTTSLYLVEGAVPSYAVAAMLMLTGLCVILLVKFRYFKYLNCFAVFLCLGTLTLCLVSVVTTAIVSIPFLESFSTCIARVSSAECQCYVIADRMNQTNNGIVVPGDDDKTYTFFGARTCSSVENTLKDFLYAMCVIYGFAAIACLFSGVLSILSLCTHRQYVAKQSDVGVITASSSRGRRTSQTSDSNRLLNYTPSQSNRGNATTESVEQRRTSQNNSRQTSRTQGQGSSSRSRPVQRSASLSEANTSTTPRPVNRHHSVTTADVQLQSGSRSGQRRPPPLIRGGFLQSHVNGPSIPVYTIPGSNEAYIALTDLPSLQMPSMDDVPAYVSDIHDSQFPTEEPPPYTPSADVIPPPMFTPSNDLPGIPESPSPQPDIVDSTVTTQVATPQADVTIETVRQVLSSSGNSRQSPRTPLNITEPDGDNTNNLNEGAASARSSPQHVIRTVSGLPPHATYTQADGDHVGNQSAYNARPRSQSASDSRSRSVSRSRENSPTRFNTRQSPALSISQNVAMTQNARFDPLVTGARPKNSRHGNQGVNNHGNRSPERNSPHHNGDAKKKRPKSPKKSDKEKSKQNPHSKSNKKLPHLPMDNNLTNLVPETKIKTPKKSSKKAEHHGRSENRNKDLKQQGDGKKRHKSISPEKKHRDSKSRSPYRMEQYQKSRKRTSSPPKGSKHLRLNIPTDDSSETDSMEGILDLVESVHTTQGQRSKDQKQSVKSKERRRNLSDSRV